MCLKGLCQLSLGESIWSSGMIPALGAGGPEFNPRNGPMIFVIDSWRSINFCF